MDKDALTEVGRKAGLAAVILFAPGGFILGATLAARHWHKRHAEKVAALVADDNAGRGAD